MRLACLVALVVATASFAPAPRPRVHRLDLQPPPRTALAQSARSLIMCASGPLAPFSEDQQATLKTVKAECFPVDPSELRYDLASPFAWSRIRQDYPALASFSNDELADGMRELGWVEGMAPFESDVKEGAEGEAPPVPLEARFYQVTIPLSLLFLVVTQLKPDLLPPPSS